MKTIVVYTQRINGSYDGLFLSLEREGRRRGWRFVWLSAGDAAPIPPRLTIKNLCTRRSYIAICRARQCYDSALAELKEIDPKNSLVNSVGHGYSVDQDTTYGQKKKHKYGVAGSLPKCRSRRSRW